jgi:hypothetical protein
MSIVTTEDLWALAQTIAYLNRRAATTFDLIVPYCMPLRDNNSPSTVHSSAIDTFATLINSCRANVNLTVFDPHCGTGVYSLSSYLYGRHKLHVVNFWSLWRKHITKVIQELIEAGANCILLLLADGRSTKATHREVNAICEALDFCEIRILQASKERNFEGEITSYAFCENSLPQISDAKHKKMGYIIIDDMISTGETLKIASRALFRYVNTNKYQSVTAPFACITHKDVYWNRVGVGIPKGAWLSRLYLTASTLIDDDIKGFNDKTLPIVLAATKNWS